MDRSINSPTPSRYRMTDVAHYHALARSQGYDLQDVEYSCYTLDASHPTDRLTLSRSPSDPSLTNNGSIDMTIRCVGTWKCNRSRVPGERKIKFPTPVI
jgi:hypothetical protein